MNPIAFQTIFESVPGLYLILDPGFNIVAVSNAYLEATMTQRNQIMGKHLFEVFPDNPSDADATGVGNLRTSLEFVIATRTAHTMAIQKYDIKGPDGLFEERYWSPINKPITNKQGEVEYIIHRVEDVTAYVKTLQESTEQKELTAALQKQLSESQIEVLKRSQEIQNINTHLFAQIENNKKQQSELNRLNNLLSSVINNTTTSIYAIDTQGKFILFNKQSAINYGGQPADYLGKTIFDLIPEDQAQQIHDEDLRIMNQQILLETENTVTVNGAKQTYHMVRFPLSDEHGKVVGMCGLATDITEIIAREETIANLNTALKEEVEESKRKGAIIKRGEERLRNLLELAPDALVMVNAQGEIKFVNLQTEKLFGYQQAELIGQKVEVLIPYHKAKEHSGYRTEFMQHPSTRNMGEGRELFGLHKNGSIIPVEISLAAIEIEEGMPPDVMSAIRDITDKKKAEQELRSTNSQLVQKNNELQIANDELKTFTSSVSHDLRSPLRAISGFSNLIKKTYSNTLDEECNRMLGIIDSNAKKMAHLIDDLLSYSRVVRAPIQATEVDITELVHRTLAELKQSYPDANPIVEVGKPQKVVCDAVLMKQVIQNLLGNAIKYSAQKSSPHIWFDSETQGEDFVFHVKDNGAGFDMQYANKLFEVFQRLHSDSEFEGTGVGLAIVERIIKKHGGQIWAESEVDKGATFYFSLPQKPITNDQLN